MSLVDKIKNAVWKILSPIWLTLRRLGILKNKIRQEYHLGYLHPQRSVEELQKHLKSQGFANHFVAWLDQDEVPGLRKLDGVKYQYHLRVYKNGEVKGHYEFTPEAHPIHHFLEHGMENKRDEFLKYIDEWLA